MGIKKYVQKPVQKDELFSAVREALDGKRSVFQQPMMQFFPLALAW